MEHFRLIAILTTDTGFGMVEESRYELVYIVNLLEVNDKNAAFYSKEFKMYFEKPSAVKYIYEVETKDIVLSFVEPLKKSEEFIRRLFFRYDWIQIGVEASGKIISVGKAVEMEESRKGLKAALLEDYKGSRVENYLEAVDNEFMQNSALIPVLNQYLHFGLLFPCIPKTHNREWNHTRHVEISEYEKEIFEEKLVYTSLVDGLRNYTITGEKLPDSKANLLEFAGEIKVPANDLLPAEAGLQFACEWGKIKINWHITLNKETN